MVSYLKRAVKIVSEVFAIFGRELQNVKSMRRTTKDNGSKRRKIDSEEKKNGPKYAFIASE